MNIKIPDTLYVGIDLERTTVDSEPLGFLVPGGTDKGAIKRKKSVNNWMGMGEYIYENVKSVDREQFEKDNPDATFSKEYYNDPTLLQYLVPKAENVHWKVLDEIPNDPQNGFRITRSISRGGRWSGNNKVVRVEDPRGFELEISVDNLVKMMTMTTVENGVFVDDCVWGREGARNILLPVNSEPYMEAKENTKYSKKKLISLRDVSIGDTIKTKATTYNEELEGVYLGLYNVYGVSTYIETERTYGWNSYTADNHIFSMIKRYIIRTEDNGVFTYHGVSKPNIIDILNKVDTPLERVDLDHTLYSEDSSGYVAGDPVWITTKKMKLTDISKTFHYVPVDFKSDIDKDIKKHGYARYPKVFTRLENGKIGLYQGVHQFARNDTPYKCRFETFTCNSDHNTWWSEMNTDSRWSSSHNAPTYNIDQFEWLNAAFIVNGKEIIIPTFS